MRGGKKSAHTNAVREFHKQFKVICQEYLISGNINPVLGAVEKLWLMKELLFLVQDGRGDLSEMTEAGTELHLSLNRLEKSDRFQK